MSERTASTTRAVPTLEIRTRNCSSLRVTLFADNGHLFNIRQRKGSRRYSSMCIFTAIASNAMSALKKSAGCCHVSKSLLCVDQL